MASRTYQNFDLLLEAAEGGAFRARVTTSPLGESPSGRFTLPFDATQLENLLLKLDPGRTGTRRAGSDPQSQASMDLAAKHGVPEHDNGLERFITCTRRQNFLLPPRRHRAFPLCEL